MLVVGPAAVAFDKVSTVVVLYVDTWHVVRPDHRCPPFPVAVIVLCPGLDTPGASAL